MGLREHITISTISITWMLVILCSIIVVIYNWKRRWIHYYGLKIPGPLALPLIGSLHIFFSGDDVYQNVMNAAARYPSIFKMFLGTDLCVITSRPEDVETIANSFLEKSKFYNFVSEYFKNAIFSVNAKAWKENRSYLNYGFSSQMLNSFQTSFAEYAKVLVKDFGELCGKEQDDLIPVIWRTTLDTTFETLMDVDPTLVKDRYDAIAYTEKIERLALHRIKTVYLHPTLFWRMSSAGREYRDISKKYRTLAERVIALNESVVKESDFNNSEEMQFRKKNFLNYQVKLRNDGTLSPNQVLEECIFMSMASTETGAVTVNSVLLVLGLYPEIQDNIFQEVTQILGNSEDITFKDINQMDYLERVIKETMRLVPIIPAVLRSLDRDVQLGSYTIPAGSQVMILIAQLHRRADIWKDPLKFDPDRFLADEVKKRPRNSFIPFSYGPRNCIGLKYGMLSVKMMLALILKEYTIRATNYKSIEDIHLEYYIVSRPKKGYKVMLERRG